MVIIIIQVKETLYSSTYFLRSEIGIFLKMLVRSIPKRHLFCTKSAVSAAYSAPNPSLQGMRVPEC